MFKKRMYLRRGLKEIIDRQEGASLVEVSIGLVLLSLLALPFFMEYSVSLQQEKIQGTEAKLFKIRRAINEYHENGNGAYPCPAGMLTPSTHVNYGQSWDCSLANFNNIVECTDISWVDPANGSICRTTADITTAVIYGAIPHETLGLTPEDVVDYWDRRLHYKVTYEQTVEANFAANSGQVIIWLPDDPEDVGVVAGSAGDGIPDPNDGILADFALYSSGENGYGSVTKAGVLHRPCGSVGIGSGDGWDNLNCQLNSVDPVIRGSVLLTEDTSTPGASAFSTAENSPTSMDDLSIMQQNLPPKLFSAHDENGTVATDPEWILTNINTVTVGIGTNLPDSDTNLHVIGAVHAMSDTNPDGGSIITPSVCGEVPNPAFDPGQPVSATNQEFMDQCFDTNLIVGDEPDMECNFDASVVGEDPAQVVHTPAMGLWSSKTYCASAYLDEGGTTQIINTQRGEAIQVPSLQNQSCATGAPTFIDPAAGTIICP